MSTSSEGAPFRKAVAKVEAQNIAEEIDSLLARLPEEISKRWEKENFQLPPVDQLSGLRVLVEKRKALLTSPHVSTTLDLPRHVKIEGNYPNDILETIEKLEAGKHVRLGQGNAGRVIASESNPEICYKIMFPISKLPIGTNSVGVEADIQDEVAALGEVAGVRVPRIHAFIENSPTQAIVMEQLDAVSIRDLLERVEEWPENFEYGTFCSSLTQFLETMHDAGYHHRDLHEGNVLIDRSTGLPRVIDFGMAAHVYVEDEAYQFQYVEAGQIKELMLVSDMGRLQRLKSLLRTPSRKGDV